MMSSSARLVSAGVLALAAACVAAFVVSDGFLLVDEVVYFLGAQALATTGGFAIPNGFSDFASPDLRILLLSEGPGGLVPQYPAGTALAGAVLIPVFGQSALIAMLRPDRLLAHPFRMGGDFDAGLIDAACAAGYRIVLEAWLAQSHGGLGDRKLRSVADDGRVGGGLLELSCAHRELP
jgi:hypothetical protein